MKTTVLTGGASYWLYRLRAGALRLYPPALARKLLKEEAAFAPGPTGKVSLSRPQRPTASKRGGPRLRAGALRRGTGRRVTLFPPSVFPLWKPPFPRGARGARGLWPIPPFSKESTKGGKPRGAPARRPLWRGRRHGASLFPCLSRPKRACRPRAAALWVAALVRCHTAVRTARITDCLRVHIATCFSAYLNRLEAALRRILPATCFHTDGGSPRACGRGRR